LASLALYIATMAPTIVYGDSAKHHMYIHDSYLGMGVNDHPLYLLLGKLFTFLPFGSEAYRINLVSALFAALAVQVVYKIAVHLTRSWRAAVVTAGVLAVSHTFWFHGVTSEVYSLHVFLVALQFYLLLVWAEQRRTRHLFLFCLVFGLSFDHLLTVLNIPAYLFFVLRKDWRVVRRGRDVLAGIGGFIAGLPLYIVAFVLSLRRAPLGEVVLEASALSHGEHMFSFPLPVLLHFTIEYLQYLAYQFPFAGLFVGLWGLFLLRKRRGVFVTLLLMYFANVIFVINYHETHDVFAMYLPSHVVFALWIGVGFHGIMQAAEAKRFSRNAALVLGIAVLVGLPVITYRLTPRLLNAVGKGSTGARVLPMRDANTYYLWPPKAGYDTAYVYGREVCRLVKPNAIILEDNGNLARLVLYQQRVLGARPDVDVPRIDREDVLSAVASNLPVRPTYIFTLEEDLYPVAELRQQYDLVACGSNLLYEVMQRQSP